MDISADSVWDLSLSVRWKPVLDHQPSTMRLEKFLMYLYCQTWVSILLKTQSERDAGHTASFPTCHRGGLCFESSVQLECGGYVYAISIGRAKTYME